MDGISLWGVGFGSRLPCFVVHDFGIAFGSFFLDGVGVFGVGLSARGPIDEVSRCSSLARHGLGRMVIAAQQLIASPSECPPTLGGWITLLRIKYTVVRMRI